MSKIRIKKFGHVQNSFLENDGWIDIKKQLFSLVIKEVEKVVLQY